jgi:hypothetical protein
VRLNAIAQQFPALAGKEPSEQKEKTFALTPGPSPSMIGKKMNEYAFINETDSHPTLLRILLTP